MEQNSSCEANTYAIFSPETDPFSATLCPVLNARWRTESRNREEITALYHRQKPLILEPAIGHYLNHLKPSGN
jgi:hypothetical protein